MASSVIQSHRAKTKNLAELCKSSANLADTRIQGYLAKSLAIMASAYIEISVREALAVFCDTRSHPVIREFVRSTIEWENSLNCSKIERILGTFDRKIWEILKSNMTDEEIAAIDSLKALRDQIAHGKDNNTGYLVITRYFDAIADFPEKLSTALTMI
jgi:hypothetical protein